MSSTPRSAYTHTHTQHTGTLTSLRTLCIPAPCATLCPPAVCRRVCLHVCAHVRVCLHLTCACCAALFCRSASNSASPSNETAPGACAAPDGGPPSPGRCGGANAAIVSSSPTISVPACAICPCPHPPCFGLTDTTCAGGCLAYKGWPGPFLGVFSSLPCSSRTTRWPEPPCVGTALRACCCRWFCRDQLECE